MAFPAKYAGYCSKCDRRVNVGEMVNYDRDTRKITHPRCPGANAGANARAVEAAEDDADAANRRSIGGGGNDNKIGSGNPLADVAASASLLSGKGPRIAIVSFNKHIASAMQSKLSETTLLEGSDEQKAIWHEMENGTTHIIVNAAAGTGKCLGRGTPVMMFSGEIVPVENIQEGDLLMGPDSLPREVLATNQGHGRLWRISPIKGEPWVCNDAHVMTLIGTNHRNGIVRDIPLNEMLAETIDHPLTPAPRCDINWKLFRVPVDFSAQKIPIDPYLLGAWLGDGTFDRPIWTFGLAKANIHEYVDKQAYRYGCVCKSTWIPEKNSFTVRYASHSRIYSYSKTDGFPFRDDLFACGKEGESKSISSQYKHNTSQVRRALLAGLLDTDGSYGNGGFEITTAYTKLAEDILFVARSLGYAAYSSIKWVQLEEWTRPRPYSRIYISGDFSELPLLRHKPEPRRQIKNVLRTGWKATSIGEGDYFGFTLDKDGRFLLGDFTVTHNSTSMQQGVLRMIRSQDASASASTYHSLGLSVLRKHFGRIRVNEHKLNEIMDSIKCPRGITPAQWWSASRAAMRLTRLCKNSMVSGNNKDQLLEMADYHNIDIETEAEQTVICDLVPQLLEGSLENCSEVDFDDMIWLPVALHCTESAPVDILIVDELQDTCLTQQFLAKIACPNGRIIGVGDKYQAIFGFRGADSSAIGRFQKMLDSDDRGCDVLPLTMTRRCPVGHVKMAQYLVGEKTIVAMPDAPFGVISSMPESEAITTMRPGDLVVCRVNKSLIPCAYELIRRGIKAVVRGRDIGAGLEALIKKLGTPETTVALAEAADNYRTMEIAKLRKQKHSEGRIGALQDKCATLFELMDGFDLTADVIRRINQIFADFDAGGEPKNAVILGTVHRTKGLEAARVFILSPELLPHPMATREWEQTQETNLCYVACTRSKFDPAKNQPGELIFCGPVPEIYGKVQMMVDTPSESMAGSIDGSMAKSMAGSVDSFDTDGHTPGKTAHDEPEPEDEIRSSDYYDDDEDVDASPKDGDYDDPWIEKANEALDGFENGEGLPQDA